MRPFKSLAAVYLILCIVAVFFADRLLLTRLFPRMERIRRLDHIANLKPVRKSPPCIIPRNRGWHRSLPGHADDLDLVLVLYQVWRARVSGCVRMIIPVCAPPHAGRGNVLALDPCGMANVCWILAVREIHRDCRPIDRRCSEHMAGLAWPAGLVLISPFTRLRLDSVSPVSAASFREFKLIRLPHMPPLVIHGENHLIVSVSHGRTLRGCLPGLRQGLHPDPGCRGRELFEFGRR